MSLQFLCPVLFLIINALIANQELGVVGKDIFFDLTNLRAQIGEVTERYEYAPFNSSTCVAVASGPPSVLTPSAFSPCLLPGKNHHSTLKFSREPSAKTSEE
jgi:hypothetical protein